jgi:hypothetical protein
LEKGVGDYFKHSTLGWHSDQALFISFVSVIVFGGVGGPLPCGLHVTVIYLLLLDAELGALTQ